MALFGGGVYVKVTDLAQGEGYRVSSFYRMDTRYGERLCVQLEDGSRVTLPKRFIDFVSTEEKLELLNQKKYEMVYKGININKKNMIILDFIEI